MYNKCNQYILLLFICLLFSPFYAQNQYFGSDEKEKVDYGGPYFFDGVKNLNGTNYSVLNNFVIGQNAVVRLNNSLDTCEILGHVLQPYSEKFTEGAVTILPDSRLMVVLRKESGDYNYMASTSVDGRCWSDAFYLPNIKTGSRSKPMLEKINGVYYMGWQDKEMIENKGRSIFNIDVSVDGINWERKYRFCSVRSFQYPQIKEYAGNLYIAATQGLGDLSGKETIVFGKLEATQPLLKNTNEKLISEKWDPVIEADKVLQNMVRISPEFVIGAHDVDMVLSKGKAYLVYEANDIRPSESPDWPEVYSALSVIDLKTNKVDKFVKIAVSEQQFKNTTLPFGAVFVPRVVQKNEKELRIYFTSEDPGKRPSQMWYIDYQIKTGKMANEIYKVKLKTPKGTFDLNAKSFYQSAKEEHGKKE